MKTAFLPLLALLAASLPLPAETVKDREGAVRADKARFENDARWAYNDIESGFKLAQATGKPLLVVMRCVPCLSCMGIDTAVLMENDALSALLDQFVCVRVMNANALDLTKFQFDFDLSFSTLFFNGDGTVYGRYGSWTHQKNSQESSLAGYKRALEAALAVHKNYPANRAALQGKQGAPLPFVSTLDIPQLAERYQRELNWDGKVVQSCVHCHMIGDALRNTYRREKKPIPAEWIYPMPAPETVGVTLAQDQVAAVAAVIPGSHADKAGVRAGDEITHVQGQPLVSVADFSWALHRTADQASLELAIRRAGAATTATLVLPSGWRHDTDSSGRVAAWPMRGMALGGMILTDLDDSERRAAGLDAGVMALRVKGLGMYGLHAAAKKAGVQKDDILVEMDGHSRRMTESSLLGHLLQNRFPGETVQAVFLRGGERVTIRLPMQ
ncbi:MAG TPA: peptidase [Verrucomicrobiales bacterium]|nr:peptidase [Verrucomicrobiales bacterium]